MDPTQRPSERMVDIWREGRAKGDEPFVGRWWNTRACIRGKRKGDREWKRGSEIANDERMKGPSERTNERATDAVDLKYLSSTQSSWTPLLPPPLLAMAFPRLPIELLDIICSHLCPSDLAALSRTSSLFCPIVQRILYRNLVLSSAKRNLSVVVTLSNKPCIARVVRTLSITVDPSVHVLRPFYCALRDALSAMSELTSLHLSLDVNANLSWVLTPHARPITYTRLQTFSSSFPFDAHVTGFLERTPALERLELDTAPVSRTAPLPQLSHAAIPRLVHFMGSCQAVKVIVPGRPLESIHIHDGDLSEDEVACLAQSTGHIAVLGAITSALLVPFLKSLARHLPYLAYLRLMAPFHVSLKPSDDVRRLVLTRSHRTDAILLQTFYEQVATTLTSMPQLLDFELSGMHWGSSFQANEAGCKRIWQAAPIKSVPEHHLEDSLDFTSDFGFVY